MAIETSSSTESEGLANKLVQLKNSLLHPRERIPLESNVTGYRLEARPTLFQDPRETLLLEMTVAQESAQYSRFYQTLPLDLGSGEVRKIYEALRQGKNAKFKGHFILNTDWAVFPPARAVGGELEGNLIVGDVAYSLKFYSNFSGFLFYRQNVVHSVNRDKRLFVRDLPHASH